MLTDQSRSSQTWQRCSPLDVLRHWPVDQPLMMLHSGCADQRWARWTILAQPQFTYRFDDRSRWVGEPTEALRDVRFTNDPLRDLDAILRRTKQPSNSDVRWRAGGWIGYFSYDLGQVIEPAARAHSSKLRHRDTWPLIELAYCPSILVFDNLAQRWVQASAPPRFDRGTHERFDLGPIRPTIDPD